jgi:hypothetical protein
MDFSGQSAAPASILGSSMEVNGLIEPARWRQFCS